MGTGTWPSTRPCSSTPISPRPTLRIFTWREPCLSIGCLQSIADIDVDACQRAGLPIVRRASGGTAVLHEATLALLDRRSPGPRPRDQRHRRVVSPARRRRLSSRFERLGVSAELVRLEEAQRGRPDGFGSAACFAALAPYELVVGSRKLVGNSQLRRRGAILHHAIVNPELQPGSLRRLPQDQLARGGARSSPAILDVRIGSLGGVLGRNARGEVVAASSSGRLRRVVRRSVSLPELSAPTRHERSGARSPRSTAARPGPTAAERALHARQLVDALELDLRALPVDVDDRDPARDARLHGGLAVGRRDVLLAPRESAR